MKPQRIQRSRKKGFSLQQHSKSLNGLECVYVGRGTRWGNPFRVVKYSDGKWGVKTDGSDKCNEILIKHGRPAYETKEAATFHAVNFYGYWLTPYSHKEGSMMDFYQSVAVLEDAIDSLRGKNLSCWCPDDEHCHADILLELANLK